ncbi:uncharacterized protein LOC130898900 [Diorhabda carinulata]|uniref:uncharacterized protein LOC130898900 n=1 Tax=Diorhabda carinulata TaxID=1163345 RepID=UPI0025A20254|nr:uncharacterized protein LOC130898900 [Diorhabda carinulata]
MPPKKSKLNNACTREARRKRVERAQQLPEQIETRNAAQRIRTAESRAQESQEQRDERLRQNITRIRAARERNIATVRVLDRQRQRISRSLTRASFVRLAFEYAPDINYSAHSKIAIGGMDKVCQYCQALKFRNEAAGMCCASGKVVLSPLPAPPEPLLSLLTGNSDDSKLFLRQVYHKIGSLMPMPDNNPKFLQIYFMGDCEERVTTRCLYNFIEQAEERAIVILLENFLEDHNQLIQLIKRVSPRLQNDNYQIVIKADKVPLGEHAGRFNAPTVDEVAVIMVGDPVDERSIKITRRDNTVSTISDLHRSYDALQYPLIFWQGQDEYHLNIKQYDPNTEWQKRGLPHAHILVWLKDRIRPEEIDQIISAEIPDPLIDQELFDIVTKHMIHGPCGAFNMTSPCMENGKCKKNFPKPHTNDTITDIDGYPMYRRRSTENGGHTFTMRLPNFPNQVEFDNQWVVPYSPLLSKTYKAHINVELCSSVKSIKYICKYVNKGSDLAIFEVQNINKNDEIARYQMGRYISSNEAIWHILSFPIHERDPAVQHLAIHLENGQRVYFTGENILQRAFEAPKTTLTEFFTLCQKPDVFGQFAKTLVYGDVPRYFTWNKSSKKWEPRKQGKPHPSITGIFKAKTLGRLYTVHPKQRECFYLRLLLVNVPGPTSFEFLRTINGRVFNTYQDACRELQLLEDDNHWDLTLADAALTSTPNNIRQLFAIILTTCYPSQAQTLWEKYKNCMTEDILHRIRQTNQCQNIDYTPEMYNEALVLIEDLCVLISNLPLNHYGMPSPNRPATDLVNTDLQREKQYDHGSLATIIMNSEPLLTAEQKIIYDRIMLAVAAEQGGFFFLDAPGGTGKTFLISLILAKIRSQQKIALAVASSGIAATLLDGGRTAHSTFKLPLDVHNKPDAMCNIKKNSGIAAVLRKSSIIIWDECTMAHKYSLEALNRTMQDLNSNNRLFGGVILLLSGDFRQTLPVIPRSTFADEINACLKQSFLWRSVETLRLTINMRVQLQNDPSAQIFSEQLLDIGNGKIELQPNTQCIKLPDNFCTVVQDKNELIQSIFPDIQNNYLNHEWLSQRAILAAKNVDVDEINFQIQQLLPGDLMSFKSIDTVVDENESLDVASQNQTHRNQAKNN